MKTLQAIAYIMILLAVAGLSGCTGRYTMESQYRTGIRTIAVPVWMRSKKVYRRKMEMQLTEALVKRIELDTPYKVTTKPRADTLLIGTIEEISQQVLSFDTDSGKARETEITVTVSFTWTDLRTGKQLVRENNLRVAGIYRPADPLNQDFFQGSEQVVNQLAKRIVERMEKEW